MRLDLDAQIDVRGLRRVCGPTTLAQIGHVHAQMVERLLSAVGDLKGGDASAHLRARGLDRLHEVLRPDDIGPLRDRVLEPLREALLVLGVKVGRQVLGWPQDFFVDDYLILRINFPFDLARAAPASAENPGVGRVSPRVRALAASRRIKDPVYDPLGYHRDYAPAAWAHGPHLDSWTGHSRNGVNIWWAMADVPGEAGMVLYPTAAVSRSDCDPRTLYLRPGVALPAPTLAPLAAGEMLVFDPEILHGTHLNVSARTRVAISMRLNASAPRFDPDCFYAREFWRRANDIEAGRLDRVVHFKREDHLAAPGPQPGPSRTERPVVVASQAADTVSVAPARTLAEGERLIVATADGRIIIWRVRGRLYAADAACPHYGLDLADGGVVDGKVHCPGCAVGFDLTTGRSVCDSLRLTMYDVMEQDGQILMTAAPLVG